MAYFSIPLLILGWFIFLIILALLLRSVRRGLIKFLHQLNDFFDEMTPVKVSTNETFRRPWRFTSQNY